MNNHTMSDSEDVFSLHAGNMQSSMNPYHQELQFLWSIVTAVTTGQVEWQSSATDRPTLPLTAAVQSLIQTLQEEGSLGSMAAQGDGSTDSWSFGSALKTFTIPERKDYDFTDRLWKVSDTSDLLLVQCFRENRMSLRGETYLMF